MGWNSQNVTQLLLVNAGSFFSGVFVYSPSAGPGNLIASVASQPGTDPYGNSYLAGITSYTAAGAQIAQLIGGQVNVTNNLNNAAGSLSAPTGIAGLVQLFSPQTGVADTSFTASLYSKNGAAALTPPVTGAFMQVSAPVVATNPVTGAPETWQDPTSSLVGFGHNGTNLIFKYILQPDGMVEFDGEMAATGAYTAGTTIFTLPANYRPAANCDVNANAVTAGGTIAGFMSITIAGAVAFSSNLAAGNVIIGNGGRFRLIA